VFAATLSSTALFAGGRRPRRVAGAWATRRVVLALLGADGPPARVAGRTQPPPREPAVTGASRARAHPSGADHTAPGSTADSGAVDALQRYHHGIAG
jgi:hypothetical protein